MIDEAKVLSTIGVLLADAMEQAVANGANSISMPDEYVALARWLAAKQDAAQEIGDLKETLSRLRDSGGGVE